MLTSFPIVGKWAVGQSSPNAGTAIAALIPPYGGPPHSGPVLYATGNQGVPNWYGYGGYGVISTVTSILFTEGITQHTVYVVRPKNWTTVKTAALAAQAVINITADPGIFSTNYRYPLPGVSPSSAGLYVYPGRVADSGIAGNDYAAYQLGDGTWVLDTVASVATLAITMTTNVPTGGVAAGAPFFLFKVPGTNSDPATGLVDPSFKPTASSNKIQQINDQVAGGIAALHPGDPMFIYSANATNAGVLDMACGYYSPY